MNFEPAVADFKYTGTNCINYKQLIFVDIYIVNRRYLGPPI